MRPLGLLVIIGTLLTCCVSGCTMSDPMRDKREAEALRNLGEVYLGQGQHTAALRELLKAEALDPENPYLQNSLGTVYAAKKRFNLAAAHFQKAIALQPDYAPARNNLGSVYLLQKNWDAAIACLQELTGNLIYATPHFPLYNIGWAYYNKKDYRQAESYFRQALDVEPNYSRALWGLGLTYRAMGNNDKALTLLEKAVQISPSYAQAHMDLGKLYQMIGQKEKAMEAYQRAADLSPGGSVAGKASQAIEGINR